MKSYPIEAHKFKPGMLISSTSDRAFGIYLLIEETDPLPGRSRTELDPNGLPVVRKFWRVFSPPRPDDKLSKTYKGVIYFKSHEVWYTLK